MRTPGESNANPLLLFDAECGLCQAAVRFLLRRDRRGRLRFAALQGRTGQTTLQRLGLPTEDHSSLVYLPEAGGSRGLRRTDGVLAVMRYLGGGWAALAGVARWIPAPWRDLLYRMVARARYAVFGPYRPRPLENPAWAKRFEA